MLPLHKLFEATVTPNTEQLDHISILKKNALQRIPLKTANIINKNRSNLSKDAFDNAKGIVKSMKIDAGKELLLKHVLT